MQPENCCGQAGAQEADGRRRAHAAFCFGSLEWRGWRLRSVRCNPWAAAAQRHTAQAHAVVYRKPMLVEW